MTKTTHLRALTRSLALLTSACAGDSGAHLLTETSAACEVSAVGTSAVPTVYGAPIGVGVYVDISRPMGGYLPTGDADPSPYRTLLVMLAERLAAPYRLGEGEAAIWATLGESIAVAKDGNAQRLALLRGQTYKAGSSDIATALGHARQRIESGELHGAAIVTDLVATGGRLGGGQAITALQGWLDGAEVANGRAGVGLLGVKTPYIGVKTNGCTAKGGLGCRFSEDLGKWVPLAEVRATPVYVVVLGRSAAAVDEIGTRLAKELKEQHALEDDAVQWELLTPRASELDVRLSCALTPGVKSARISESSAGLRCNTRGSLNLSCVAGGLGAMAVQGPSASWPFVSLQGATADKLGLALDCDAIRSKAVAKPGDPLALAFDLQPISNGAQDWSAWNTATDMTPDTFGRTLRLDSFLEAARVAPAPRRVTCGGVVSAFAR